MSKINLQLAVLIIFFLIALTIIHVLRARVKLRSTCPLDDN
jgi:hypothetical protein